MNMDTYTFRFKVEGHTEKAIKDLEEVKKIYDINEQCSKINFYLEIHQKNFDELKQKKPEEYIDNYYPWKGKYSLNNYEKKIKELGEFKSELLQKSGKIREQKQKNYQNQDHQLKTAHCSYCQSKPPTNHYIYSTKNKILKPRKRNASLFNEWLFCSEAHFEKWHKKNYFTCVECQTEKWDGKYKRSKSKKDGQKFCSDSCFYTHYAETCDNCLEKCVKKDKTGYAQTYYRDGINQTGTLCSKCHQEQLKEEREERKKDREWEENSKRLSKNMDDLVEGMEDAVKGERVDNSRERERERERTKPYWTTTITFRNHAIRN